MGKELCFHDSGKVGGYACTRVCMCGCLYVCTRVCVHVHTRGRALSELVCGRHGDKGAFPTEGGRKEPGGKEGIETHHKIRASGGKKSPAP